MAVVPQLRGHGTFMCAGYTVYSAFQTVELKPGARSGNYLHCILTPSTVDAYC